MVRWRTWGKYAHVAARIDDLVYEALPGKGVICTALEEYNRPEDSKVFDVVWLTSDAEAAAEYFLTQQVGKPYDYWGVLSFLPRWRPKHAQAKWFCSELIQAAFGNHLLARAHPWKVDPTLLSYSPNLEEAK